MGRDYIVITAYGHGKTIDKIAVSLFEYSWHYDRPSPSVETYCNTINSLELKGDSWVFAKKIPENTQYDLDKFFPQNFSNLISKLDTKSIQTVLREVETYDIAKSLAGEDEKVKEKIFSNMSKRAAQMLKEDMRDMGPIKSRSVEESQERIINVIYELAKLGMILLEGESK